MLHLVMITLLFFSQEITQRLLEQLNTIRIQPQTIIDLGAGTGYSTDLLTQRYPQAQVIAIDLSTQMSLQNKQKNSANKTCCFIAADAEELPLVTDSVDIIFSNLLLHWCNDVPAVFAEIQRVLKPGGLFIFSMLGPDTFKEVRQSWAQIDDYAHTHTFTDMHNIGDETARQPFYWSRYGSRIFNTDL